MSIKQCPACKSIVDEDAKVCKYCRKRFGLPLCAKVSIGVVAFLAAIYLWNDFNNYIGSFNNGASSSHQSENGGSGTYQSESIITIGPDQLLGAYLRNEVAADADYKGNQLEITGTIESIGKDIIDKPYIAIYAGHSFFMVQCLFTKADEPNLARLSPGMQITIDGRCRGKMGNIILDHCSFKDVRRGPRRRVPDRY